MRPTIRRNGKCMVTLRITHHLDRERVQRAVARALDIYEHDGLPSKTWIEEKVRAQLLDSADAVDWFEDRYTDRGEWEALLARANEALDHHWPNWLKDKE